MRFVLLLAITLALAAPARAGDYRWLYFNDCATRAHLHTQPTVSFFDMTVLVYRTARANVPTAAAVFFTHPREALLWRRGSTRRVHRELHGLTGLIWLASTPKRIKTAMRRCA